MMFFMRLALAFGEPDVFAFLDRLPDRVLELWREYDLYEPIGGKRLDWNAAMIARQITQASGKTFSKVGSTSDFLLEFKPIDHRQSAKDMERNIMQWVNAARIVHGEEPYA